MNSAPFYRIPLTNRMRRIFGFGIGTIAAIGAAWLGGFLWFTGQLPREVDNKTQYADAIVVLTGGVGRLDAGLNLLADNRAKKLFVSGVAAGTTHSELRKLTVPQPNQFDCCVILGHDASDTEGNAMETAIWMASEEFKSLLIVTASYHMPRSLVEFRRAMPNVNLIPQPVFSDHVKLDNWWAWPGTALLIVNEFNKYLVSLFRSKLLGQPRYS